MRTLNSSLQARLDAGTTSLCHVLTITRKDGTILRFTDRDVDLTISSNVYTASNSLQVSAITTTANNGIQSTNCGVIFDSTGITEEDAIRGLYDNARVVFGIADWAYPSYGIITLLTGTLSTFEVTDKLKGSFECRGILTTADARIGEYYSPNCRADLGDARCGVDLAAITTTGTVTSAPTANRVVAELVDNPTDGYYSFGVLTWTSGDNDGFSIEITNQYAVSGTEDMLYMSLAMPYDVQVGDTFELVPGCDKRLTTCITKFSNAANFRGEPYAPLNDFPTDFKKV